MLEEFAVDYLIQGPRQMLGYMLCSVVVGGLASAFYPKSDVTLTRAPYLFYFGLNYFLTSLVDLPSVKTPQAIETGTAWILVLISVLSNFAFGFFMGRLAAARSRDAYGHATAAILAFIPFANLWLYFVRSKGAPAAPKPSWLTRGFVGVLASIVFVGLGNAVMREAETGKMRAFAESSNLAPDTYVRFLLNNLGLEETLGFYVRSVPVPSKVDELTTLTSMKAHENNLESAHLVEGLWVQIVGISESDLARRICSAPFSLALLKAGAVLRHVYNDQNGRELAKVVVTTKDCGL